MSKREALGYELGCADPGLVLRTYEDSALGRGTSWEDILGSIKS